MSALPQKIMVGLSILENQITATVIIVFLLLFVVSTFLQFLFLLSQRKIRLREIEKNSLKITHQKRMIQATILAQEKERLRISQDFHDAISAKLNAISLYARLLQDGDLNAEDTNMVIKNILKAIDRTLVSAREISHNLTPVILTKLGFNAAFEELFESFNASKKILIEPLLNYPDGYLNLESELHLFRITQELISNSITHGKAQKITLKIEIKDNGVTYNYVDNGIGFNTQEIADKKGLGFTNIENRIDLLKGRSDISSTLNNGFKISINI
jgi:signal transduction histidine kinase